MPDIAGELAAWARQGASGALEIPGKPGGAIHLSQGYLCYAECSLAPGLGSRLIHSGKVPALRWNDIEGQAGPDGDIGGLLIAQALVTAGQLQSMLRSVTLDALVALTSALRDVPFVPSTRFRPGKPHWAGGFLRLDPTAAWADVGGKATRLGQYSVQAGARPQLCRPGRPWTVLQTGLWTVACRIDGTSTVGDLAQRHGLALCDVQEWVGQLGQAGLCLIAAPGPAAGAGSSPTAATARRELTARPRPRHRAPVGPGGPRSREPGRPPGTGARPRPAAQEAAPLSAAQDTGPVPAAQDTGPVPAAQDTSPVPAAQDGPWQLPRRKPGATLAGRPLPPPRVVPWAGAGQPDEGGQQIVAPHPDLLHRVLHGLRRLS
jgi:hypothetical protein